MESKAQKISALQGLIDSVQKGGCDAFAPSSDKAAPNVEITDASSSYVEGFSEETEEAAAAEKTPEKAFSRILRMVSYRERCTSEVVAKLKQEGYPEDAISHAIERAQRSSFIDDTRFARSFVLAALQAGKGKAGIQRELERKGIANQVIEAMLMECEEDVEPELDRALALLRRHPPRSKDLRSGAYRKLISKGFSSEIASRASRMYVEQEAIQD